MQSWMIGLVSGIVFVAFWPALPAWPVPLILAGVALFLTLRPGSVYVTLASGISIGCALAIVYGYALLEHRLTTDCVKVPVVVIGEVASLPRTSNLADATLQQRFEFAVVAMSPPRCAGPRRLMLSYYGDNTIRPGERWQFEVTLKKPWGLANPGSFNMQAWFAQSGIDGVGSVRHSATGRRLSEGGAPHHRLRLRISERISELPLAEDIKAILKAITVADKNSIDNSLWTLFQVFGMNHLLVISGLHVGLAAALGFLCGNFLIRLHPRLSSFGGWIPPFLGLSIAFLYAALAGF
jgi:competence protein ComEC